MKLLVFSEETDTSSDIVCSWLQKNNIPYIRINSEKFVNPQLKITETPDTFSVTAKYKGETVDFSKVETVWFRRGYMYIYPFYAGKDIPSTIINELNKYGFIIIFLLSRSIYIIKDIFFFISVTST